MPYVCCAPSRNMQFDAHWVVGRRGWYVSRTRSEGSRRGWETRRRNMAEKLRQANELTPFVVPALEPEVVEV